METQPFSLLICLHASKVCNYFYLEVYRHCFKVWHDFLMKVIEVYSINYYYEVIYGRVIGDMTPILEV